jgi:hypothetical protein
MAKKVQSIFVQLVGGWNRFWFEFDASSQLALFRPAFAILMFFFALSRTPDLKMFFSSQGIMPTLLMADSPEVHFRFSILTAYDSMGLIWIIHVALLSSCLLLAFNIFPRAAAIVAFLCHVTFLNRNMAVIYGVDTISAFYLFYLCFMDYRTRAVTSPDFQSMLGSAAMRLAQIQLCIVYGYSGLNKVQGAAWWKGEALWYILSNPQMAHLNFSWISHFPVIVVVATYSTLFWEVYFPALVWVPKMRYPALIGGVLLHIGIGIVMGLTSFALMMVILYMMFLRAEDADKIAQCVKNAMNRLILRKVSLTTADQSIV